MLKVLYKHYYFIALQVLNNFIMKIMRMNIISHFYCYYYNIHIVYQNFSIYFQQLVVEYIKIKRH